MEQGKLSARKYRLLISLMFIAVALAVGYFSFKTEKDELKEYGVETSAVIKGIGRRQVVYGFSDGISLYTKKEKMSYRFTQKNIIGDTITVIYSQINP